MLYTSTGVVARPSSPSPSLTSSTVDAASVVGRETDLERCEREEEEKRRRIQLYVFVMRCIAYPFSAKQPTDMVRRHAKVTKQQLQSIRERFQVRSLCLPSDCCWLGIRVIKVCTKSGPRTIFSGQLVQFSLRPPARGHSCYVSMSCSVIDVANITISLHIS